MWRSARQAGRQLRDGVAGVQHVAEVEQVAVRLLGYQLEPQRAQQHLRALIITHIAEEAQSHWPHSVRSSTCGQPAFYT